MFNKEGFLAGLALGLVGKPLLRIKNIVGDTGSLQYALKRAALRFDVTDTEVAGNSFMLVNDTSTLTAGEHTFSFYIGSHEYVAARDMSWKQWHASSYYSPRESAYDINIDDDDVYVDYGDTVHYILYSSFDNRTVCSIDAIMPGEKYIID